MARLFATLLTLATLVGPAFPGQVPGPAATPIATSLA